MDSPAVYIPHSLPCLFLKSQVLLPTAFARITFTGARRHKALRDWLEGGLEARDSQDLIIAVVPHPGINDASGAQDDDDEGGTRGLSLAGKLGTVATAARVLQVARVVQSNEWAVLLEGLCRISIEGVIPPSNAQEPEMALVHQLELKPGGKGGALADAGPPTDQGPGHSGVPTGATGNGSSAAAGASEPSLQELGRQLKATTKSFLMHLQRHAGLPATRRVLAMLDAVPPWRAADVVAAALGSTIQERLAVLRAVEHRLRVRLALSIAQQALDAVRAGLPGVEEGGKRPAAGHPVSSIIRGGQPVALDVRGGRAGGGGRSQLPRIPGFDGLGEGIDEEDADDLDAVMGRLARQRPPPEVARAAVKEYRRLRQTGDHHPGASASRAYLEALADIPWGVDSGHRAAAGGKQPSPAVTPAGNSGEHQGADTSGPAPPQEGHGQRGPGSVAEPGGAPLSLKAARAVLDKQHYGLDKVKDRVVEYLAVLRLRGTSARAPILCFIGPPGVGKTSLARSVAEVLGRPFVRIALGGVRDEAEVRGHRRTYVGAMPGRIIQGLRRAGVNDPVMLLDEVDKLGKDAVRGDPSAALLEVLDPEQNSHFTDAYLGLPFDLSRVTFVATANRAADIPAPLLDRLEVITLSGYTLEERVHIGVSHLLPRALADHGLTPMNMHVPESVIQFVCDRYTREAGVRSLSRCLAAICRYVAVTIVTGHDEQQQAPLAAGTHEPVTLPAGHEQQGGHVPQQQLDQHQQQASLHPPPPSPLAGSLAEVSEAPLDSLTGHHPHSHSHLQQTGALAAYPSHGGAKTTSPQATSSTRPAAPHPPPATSGRGLLAPLLAPFTRPAASGVVQAGVPPASSLPRGSRPTASGPGSNGNHHHPSSASSSTAAASLTSPQALNAALQVQGHIDALQQQLSAQQQGVQAVQARRVMSQHHQQHAMQHAPSMGALAVSSGASSSSSGSTSVGLVASEHPHLPYPPDLLLQQQQAGAVIVTEQLVEQVLGPPRYGGDSEALERVSTPGAAAGLVWTAVGGSVQYIECVRISEGQPGRPGTLTLTGQVGEVLEESARIALSWIRAHARELGLTSVTPGHPPRDHDSPSAQAASVHAEEFGATSVASHHLLPGPPHPGSSLSPGDAAAAPRVPGGEVEECGSTQPHVIRNPASSWDIHVHLPAGAIPKDGPSAGITLAVALLSLLTGRAARGDTAMTGELTLRGLVLPIGGVKEKLLAARHAGVARVILPARNMRDVVADVPVHQRSSLTLIPVERLEQVLAAAFDPPPVIPSAQAARL